jgi:ParB family chromosome partitioning protein
MKEKKLGKGLDMLFGAAAPAAPAIAEPAPPPPISAMSAAPPAMPTIDEKPVCDPAPASPLQKSQSLRDIDVAEIYPNPRQPRKNFDDFTLEQLAGSIKTDGIVQPVLLRKVDGRYELVAGERRWRAAQKAGLPSIPAIILSVDDAKSMEIALVENIQREDLNAIEKAIGLREMMTQFGYTQDELGKRIGLDRSTVANILRLLDLPEDVQDAVSRGTLSMGHARALLGVEGERDLRYLAKRVITEGISVRKLENLIRLGRRKSGKKGTGSRDPLVVEIEDKLRQFFGTRVYLEARKKRGRIVIDYYDNAQLGEILSKLGISV